MSQPDNPGQLQETPKTSQKILKWIFLIICAGSTLFHLYTTGIGVIPATVQRVIHLMLIMIVIFFCMGGIKRSPVRWSIDVLCTLAAIFISVYYIHHWYQRTFSATAGVIIATNFEIALGIIMVLLVLEITRRTTGWSLVVVVLVFLAYVFYGSNLPGFLGHRGYTLTRVITYLYLLPEGIYGLAIKISASFVVLFVTFGAILEATGGGQTFIDLGFALTGRFRGGSGKTAVISSALMGTISGSPVANVVTTGPFTIPLMKRAGFPPEVAGAIEAVASTGGMILPPVMGAAAFLMAENLGVSYAYIAKSAVIPALLYYLCIFFMTDLTAIKYNVMGQSKSELPVIKEVLKKGWHLMLPLVVLIGLIVYGKSVTYSAFWSIVLALVMSQLNFKNRTKFFNILKALQAGIMGSAAVAAACASAGIILGVINITGLGVRFSRIVIAFSNNNLFIACFLTMIISIILGMGLPAIAVYMITAVLCAPALIGMGATPLAAHMFVFYFGIMCNLTPPVALAAYAAAGISGSSINKTGYTAFRMAIVSFMVPYFFIYSQYFLMQGSVFLIILNFIFAAAGTWIISVVVTGHFKMHKLLPLERILLAIGGFLIVQPVFWLAAPGVVISGIVFWFYLKRGKKAVSA